MLTAILTFVVITTDRARQLVAANTQLNLASTKSPIDQSVILQLEKDITRLSQPITQRGMDNISFVYTFIGRYDSDKALGMDR
jgi:hypothetical protein